MSPEVVDDPHMYLSEFYDRAGNDMETLLTDITIESDGMTLDPAAWADSVCQGRQGRVLRRGRVFRNDA
jgi:hypothetical protein